MIKFKTILKKSIVLFTLVALLTCVFFVSSKPKVVKADVLATTGIALGGAVLLSYFASMGIDLVFNGGSNTSLEEYANSIIADYESSTGNVNTYFDSEGTFIGTESDLNIILSDQSQAYWNMGKDMASWLESVKDWYVTENGLSVGNSSSLFSNRYFVLNGTNIRIYEFGTFTYPINTSLPSFVELSGDITIENTQIYVNSTDYFQFYFRPYANSVYSNGYCKHGDYASSLIFNTNPIKFYNNHGDVINNAFGFRFFTDGVYLTLGYIYRSGRSYGSETIDCVPSSMPDNDSLRIPLSEVEGFTSITIDGSLSDGYSDYENALNQGLTDQADNENASVAVGVGSVGDALTAEQVKEAILEALAENSYSGSLTGVYENQAAAEEELEGEQEFSPTYPSDWVIVNGLEDFFPFCIPWDLYSVIATLNVPPETPKFTYVVSTGGVFDDQEIEVDLSAFDTVAQIFRIMMAIGFLVFLIIKTRDLIRG